MSWYPYNFCQIDTIDNPYLIVTRSKALPISIEEVKTQVKIDSCDNSDDAMIRSIILAVSNYFEQYTNRTLLSTTYKTFRDFFPSYILLRKSQYLSLVSFQYFKNGVLTTIDPATYQVLQSNDYSKIIPLVNSSFPIDADSMAQVLQIVFNAGFGQKSNDIPSDIRNALLQHAAYLWANRGDCDCNDASGAIPPVSQSVYNMWRIKNITGLPI